MKFNLFMQGHSNVKGENRLLKYIGAFIGTGFLVNSIVTIYALEHQTTILVPPVINTKLEIVGNSASEEYIRVFGRYSMWLALNYSPATARSQFSELLTMFAPEKYAEVRKAFYVLADTVEMGHVSSVFHITRIKVDRVRSEMEIDGVRKQYVNDQLLEEKDKIYMIEYRVTDGRFLILKLYEQDMKNQVSTNGRN
jgi:conjugal transfer pilus assembly protein TraE